jgi:hypothetical protein
MSATAPVVKQVIPNVGPLGGCDTVALIGWGYTGVSAVTFGSQPAGSFVVISDTTVRVMAPPGAAGTVDIRVTTPLGTSAVRTGDRYTYADVGAVTVVTPNRGTSQGGTKVVISGSGFTHVTSVQFGSSAAGYSINSDTSITALSPPGTGSVNITVTTPQGTSAISSADVFFYS